MATTTLAITSERIGQTTLAGQVQNIDSAVDWNESFIRPAGFGDCLVAALYFVVTGIQTAVAMTEGRAPAVFMQTNVVKDFITMSPWYKLATLALWSGSGEITRPVLWRADEILNIQVMSEDTGVGDTSDIACYVRVMRLRNQVPSM